ncbi:hypothetical protein EUGRSUZ_C01935 [Eucalyptus grandis]|uniref:Uncharacterized protein n=2 Tax=Eucalyptus grandis TaxID=71139 RepID=A0ACC3LG67_EUCGR|nr:hypothetical protein EUGRSUZ_C01935 [Eucalyptus grandis]
MRGVVAKLQDQFPAASFKVLNFGEGENHSHLARVLFEYDITVIKLPQNNGGCPIPRVEIIRDFLRSADEWLSSDAKTNMLLMHCERGAWPVLAFMLASLLLYRKKQDGSRNTQHDLQQLRYMQYVSMQNASSDWPALNKLLVIKSVRLSSVPHLDVQWGCQIIGQEPFIFADQTLKVLSSTPYKQVEGEKVQFNVFCYVRDDVVLEFMSLDADLEHGESMFRAMFNTAFISDSVLKLMFEDMDVSWDHKDQYPKEFMAEIDFFQVNADTLLEWADLSGDEVEKENRSKKSIGKIEPKELPAEERAVHFMTLNYDASTSPEENEVLELPIQSNIEPTSTLPQVPTSPSESLADSALEGTFESFELATKSPYTSPSVELDQQSGTAVEGNGLSFSLSDVTVSDILIGFCTTTSSSPIKRGIIIEQYKKSAL